MKRRLKLLWCWIRHAGRNVSHYWRLLRWKAKGEITTEPWDLRSLSYNCDRLKVAIEAWLERRKAEQNG